MHLFTGGDAKSSANSRDSKMNGNKVAATTTSIATSAASSLSTAAANVATATTSMINSALVGSAEKEKVEERIGSRQVEDIFTKSARLMCHHWEDVFQSFIELNEKIDAMIPTQAYDLIYWKNPIQSVVAFCISISALITYMSMSALAASAFWLLGFLILVGLYKLYNFILANCLGRLQPDLFESIFPADVCVSEANAQAFAEAIRVHGTYLMRKTRSVFLWENFASSLMYGLFLLKFYYLGLVMNALTLTLFGLILTFTVPKIYQVHQEPIDRILKQIQDRFKGTWSKFSSKLPNKPKTN